MNPKELREKIAKGEIKEQTSGMALGYAQANLVILPKEYAKDFQTFCMLNPKPCPLLEIVHGKFTQKIAKNANIYTDIPKYFIYENGIKTKEAYDISEYYNDDLIGFLLGCSFSFEEALLEKGLEIRHISNKCNVPITPDNAKKAKEITANFPLVHGAPVQIGNAKEIGINNILKADFGDDPIIKEGEIPVFWACGVTPQNVIMKAKLPFVITHAPGHMFISDILNSSLKY
ncbi:DUF1445 domain-containing protein [Campylobacter coli]